MNREFFEGKKLFVILVRKSRETYPRWFENVLNSMVNYKTDCSSSSGRRYQMHACKKSCMGTMSMMMWIGMDVVQV